MNKKIFNTINLIEKELKKKEENKVISKKQYIIELQFFECDVLGICY